MNDRFSAEEVELLEKKQAMKELLKEKRRTKVEGWRDTLAVEDGTYSKDSNAEGDLYVFEVGVHQKDMEWERVRIFLAKPWRRKKRAVVRPSQHHR